LVLTKGSLFSLALALAEIALAAARPENNPHPPTPTPPSITSLTSHTLNLSSPLSTPLRRRHPTRIECAVFKGFCCVVDCNHPPSPTQSLPFRCPPRCSTRPFFPVCTSAALRWASSPPTPCKSHLTFPVLSCRLQPFTVCVTPLALYFSLFFLLFLLPPLLPHYHPARPPARNFLVLFCPPAGPRLLTALLAKPH